MAYVTRPITDPKCISFYRRPHGGDRYLLGTASLLPGKGWRFVPNVAGRSPSRKFHATWEQCVPRWVGYPDSCESTVVG